jgi:hypothetical protein
MLSPTLLEALRGLLAWAEAQTHEMVVPGRIPAHLQSSIHSPSRVVSLPTLLPSGRACRTGFIPTRCATVSLLTYWKTALTYAPFNCSWDITI